MLPTYVLVLIVLANTLQFLAYLKPRRAVSIAPGVVLLLLPMILRRWVFGGSGEYLDVPFRMLAYVFYGYVILHLFVVRESFLRVLFSGLGIVSFSFVSFVAADMMFFAAGVLPEREAVVAARLLYCGGAVLCWPLLRRHVRAPFREVLEALERQRWYFVLAGQLTIVMLGAGLAGLTQHYQGLYVSFVAAAGILSIVLFYIAIYHLIHRERANQFLRTEAASAERLVRTYDFYGEELARKEEDLRRLRHDFRHMAGYLAYLARNGNMDEIGVVLRSLGASEPGTDAIAHCENTTVNALVASCFSRARARGIRCTAALQLPGETGIPDVELAILFGNALENCLKGAVSMGGDGRIELSAKRVRGCLIIRFENNYAPERYEKGSGFGLMSMRQLCEKYDGSLRAEESDDIYRVTALLQPPSRQGDSHVTASLPHRPACGAAPGGAES